MSWDEHIKALKASGADEACICDHDGNLWARSANFNASPQEISTMIKVAKGESLSDTEQLQCNNIPYMKVGPMEDHTGCKLISKNEGEKALLCVGLSNKAVVLASKTGPAKNIAVEACEKEVKYLKDSGL